VGKQDLDVAQLKYLPFERYRTEKQWYTPSRLPGIANTYGCVSEGVNRQSQIIIHFVISKKV